VADDRFEQLEFKVAHLEKTLQDLSDVLYRQQREIEALQARGQLLLEQVQQLEDRGGGADADSVEIPPHY
jgi:SlyX protein